MMHLALYGESRWSETRFRGTGKARFEAVRLWEKSALNQSEVARRVPVSRQTVSRWAEEFRAGGREALKKAERAGRKRRIGNACRNCCWKAQRSWAMKPRFGPVRGWRT